MRFSLLRLLIVTAILGLWLGVTAAGVASERAQDMVYRTPAEMWFRWSFGAAFLVFVFGSILVGIWFLAGEIEKQIRKEE